MNTKLTKRMLASLALLAIVVGCHSTSNLVTDTSTARSPLTHELFTDSLAPSVDLPLAMREANWDGGSCVHASTVHLLRWQGQYAMADWWRGHYTGGDYPSRLHQRLDGAGLRYAYTVDGDTEFLMWALRTRRGAGVTYWPQHAVNLVHLDEERAGLLDNNRVEQIIWISRDDFLSHWKDYGGWAWTLVYDPSPPVPYYVGVQP